MNKKTLLTILAIACHVVFVTKRSFVIPRQVLFGPQLKVPVSKVTLKKVKIAAKNV